MSSFWRLFGLAVVLGTIGIVSIASSLEPSPHGLGTHHQLGMSPCNFLVLTGIPCPGCGMTTTFSLLVHGRLGEALGTQPFGVVLFCLMILFALSGLIDLLFDRKLLQRMVKHCKERQSLYLSFFATGMFIGWVFKIARHNFGL